jgi:iron complex transport system substrate-binding protein
MRKRSLLHRGRYNAALVAIFMTLTSAVVVNAAEAPKRIVSLNMCTDELVLRLADRSNIASITWLSRDPISANVTDLATDVPINHGLAEEIIPLDPDLVVAGTFTARTAVAMLKQTGFPVTEFGVARNIGDVRAEIRKMAALVGEPARGEALVASFDERLANIGNSQPARGRPRSSSTPTASLSARARWLTTLLPERASIMSPRV